jgi:hypothetical protein
VYVNGDYVIATYGALSNKRILEKLIRERKSLAFYATVNKSETLNEP